MTIQERKECDEREERMWSRGFNCGLWTAATLAGVLAAIAWMIFK